MNGSITYPWGNDFGSDKWKWGMGFLSQRGIEADSVLYNEPESRVIVNQIEKMVEWTLGSRNWIVCLCESSSYMRILFDYVLVSYVFTTQERAVVVDVEDLLEAADKPSGDKRDIVEHANLLLVTNCDPNNTHLKWNRGAVANIFHRRKRNKLATVMDVFVGKIPDKTTPDIALQLSRRIVDIFGETTYELFTTQDAKRVVIRPEKGDRQWAVKPRPKPSIES